MGFENEIGQVRETSDLRPPLTFVIRFVSFDKLAMWSLKILILTRELKKEF